MEPGELRIVEHQRLPRVASDRDGRVGDLYIFSGLSSGNHHEVVAEGLAHLSLLGITLGTYAVYCGGLESSLSNGFMESGGTPFHGAYNGGRRRQKHQKRAGGFRPLPFVFCPLSSSWLELEVQRQPGKRPSMMVVALPRLPPTSLLAPRIALAFRTLKMSIWNVNTLLLCRKFFFTFRSS